MSTEGDSPAGSLSRLRLQSGGFAMVALDQRESLREMFPPSETDELVTDAVLSRFKADAARVLTPGASGVLLDHPLGVGDSPPQQVADGCGLLLAADHLESARGAGVHGSSLDPAVTVDLIRSTGAAGIKYLVIWRRGDDSWRSHVEAFLALAREAGVASFVEGIVRPERGGDWASTGDRHDAIVEAAAELSVGASVYKAEVPGYIPGDLGAVTEQSRRVSEVVDGEWVVLSNGVEQPDFARAVERSCAGGAHGFLAGRAIWADTIRESDPVAALLSRSVDRLRNLVRIVEESRTHLTLAARAGGSGAGA